MPEYLQCTTCSHAKNTYKFSEHSAYLQLGYQIWLTFSLRVGGFSSIPLRFLSTHTLRPSSPTNVSLFMCIIRLLGKTRQVIVAHHAQTNNGLVQTCTVFSRVSTHPPFWQSYCSRIYMRYKYKWFLHVSTHPRLFARKSQLSMGTYSEEYSTRWNS